MPLDYDEDEFNDFLGKIEDVDSIIKGLAAGTVEPESVDVYKQEEKLKREGRERACPSRVTTATTHGM